MFPFKAYFADAPGGLFKGRSYAADMESARGCWRHLRTMFQELEECRAFELLKVCALATPGSCSVFCMAPCFNQRLQSAQLAMHCWRQNSHPPADAARRARQIASTT